MDLKTRMDVQILRPVNVIEGNQVEEKGADNSGLYQWAAVIAAGITAAGSIAAAKYRKHG